MAGGFDYEELMNLVSGDDFEERPVPLEEFLYGFDYLNLTDFGKNPIRLSDIQYQIVDAASQIYKKETLISLYGPALGAEKWRSRKNEIVMQLGKGSGKDFMSTIAVAYMVYQLLCLRDPAAYYGKTKGNSIDIINIAINAQQANVVFFSNFVTLIDNSPWFTQKYETKANVINFKKNVSVYSGHSEREAFEGYNTLCVILDEISGFAIDSLSGNTNAKTADAIYDMYSASVTSRFDEFGKLLLLSFPRYKDDFIQTRYNAVVKEKEEIWRETKIKLDPELPDGLEDNEIVIEWVEEHILSYNEAHVFALRRASWSVHPDKTPQSYVREFNKNYIDALSRFACMPPDSIDGFFKDKQKVDAAFTFRNGVREDGVFEDWFVPDPDKFYYIHVDLAKKVDNCAVSLAHVEKFTQSMINNRMGEPQPQVIVDAVRWWTPSAAHNVDFADVRNYIVSLRQRGFNIKRVTFDRWQSEDMIDYLNDIGIRAEKLSVAIAHYTDLAMVVQEGRINGPDIPLLRKELLQLRVMPNGKLDHPRSGSKDLADATAGAVFNAIALTPRKDYGELEVLTPEVIRKRAQEEVEARIEQKAISENAMIKDPFRKAPDDIASYIDRMRVV